MRQSCKGIYELGDAQMASLQPSPASEVHSFCPRCPFWGQGCSCLVPPESWGPLQAVLLWWLFCTSSALLRGFRASSRIACRQTCKAAGSRFRFPVRSRAEAMSWSVCCSTRWL